jgi:hypothetical protein
MLLGAHIEVLKDYMQRADIAFAFLFGSQS